MVTKQNVNVISFDNVKVQFLSEDVKGGGEGKWDGSGVFIKWKVERYCLLLMRKKYILFKVVIKLLKQ